MFSLGQMFSSHVVFFRVQMSLIKVDWLSIGKHQDLMMYGSAWLQLGKKNKKEQTEQTSYWCCISESAVIFFIHIVQLLLSSVSHLRFFMYM